jgi:hypothetical protein
MATVTYDDLIQPLTSDAILSDAISVFAAAGFPAAGWTAFDEPFATLEFESRALADLSVLIAAIGRMGITSAADGDALTLHAKDVFDEDRKPALQTQGAFTLTDASGSPQSFAAGDLLFSSKTNHELTYKNVAAVSVPALGTSSSAILAADATGAVYNINGSDLQFITPPTGITLNVAPFLTWITQSGADEESDDSLRTRITAKWGSLSATGSYDAYVFAGLSSSPEVNRVRIQEDPTAVDPTPMVRVWLAGPTGPIGSSTLTASASYIIARSPLGVRVSVENTNPYTVTVRGTYKVKASQAAAAKAYIAKQFGDWFAGRSIVVNGETVPGLGIGDGVLVAQVMEIIMSAPGVSTVTLDDGLGNYLPNVLYGEFMGTPPAADDVATLNTSDALLVQVLTA